MKGPVVTWQDMSSDEYESFQMLSKVHTSHKSKKVRYKSDIHLCSLPKDVLILLLSGLPLDDLIRMRRVNTMFRELIDSTPVLWSSANLYKVWPNQHNFVHLKKAAQHGNVEALIKMGVSYLYNNGLSNGDNTIIQISGEEASHMFLRVEKLVPASCAFTWIFYRPPWSVTGTCCKSVVLQSLLKQAKDIECNKSVYYCIARTLSFFNDEEKTAESRLWFQLAAQKGCSESTFIIWQQQYWEAMLDKATELEGIRALRNLVKSSPNCLEAQVALCTLYAKNKFGGVGSDVAFSFVRNFFQSSKHPPVENGSFSWNRELVTSRVWQILVDWLVEVCNLKDFSMQIVHLTVQTIDRYLMATCVPKSELQLLGITALLLCTRYLGREILTVREAAWVTDNTYQYLDVVQMMGQITATLRGNLRVPTLVDYTSILLSMAGFESTTSWMAYYLCDIVLLHPEMGQFKPAVIAASCLVLAGFTVRQECIWRAEVIEFTGFKVTDLTPCISVLYSKCVALQELEDFKSRKLEAIAQRYKHGKYCKVSDLQFPSRQELMDALNICSLSDVALFCKPRNVDKESVLEPLNRERGN